METNGHITLTMESTESTDHEKSDSVESSDSEEEDIIYELGEEEFEGVKVVIITRDEEKLYALSTSSRFIKCDSCRDNFRGHRFGVIFPSMREIASTRIHTDKPTPGPKPKQYVSEQDFRKSIEKVREYAKRCPHVSPMLEAHRQALSVRRSPGMIRPARTPSPKSKSSKQSPQKAQTPQKAQSPQKAQTPEKRPLGRPPKRKEAPERTDSSLSIIFNDQEPLEKKMRLVEEKKKEIDLYVQWIDLEKKQTEIQEKLRRMAK